MRVSAIRKKDVGSATLGDLSVKTSRQAQLSVSPVKDLDTTRWIGEEGGREVKSHACVLSAALYSEKMLSALGKMELHMASDFGVSFDSWVDLPSVQRVFVV